MIDQETRNEIEQVKEVLKKMDPELAVMAIRQAQVDLDEVDKIKSFLAERHPAAVQFAVAELEQEVQSRELMAIQKDLAAFSPQAKVAAAVELGLAAQPALCLNSIPACKFHCIELMHVRCMQDMYVLVRRDEMISQSQLEATVGRGAARAWVQAQQLGESDP
jgi:hypothetical protein